MVEEILLRLSELGDEKTKQKYIKDGCDTQLFGVKVGDLKKLVKEYKINNDSQLAIELIETKNYDAMYLGFLIMKPSDIDKHLFVKWDSYSEYYRIRIHSLAYGMAEHSEFEYFINYYQNRNDDVSQSIYYAILAGRVIIDPQFDSELLESTARYIAETINSPQFQNYNYTKLEMHNLIGYIGIQVSQLSDLMIELSNLYIEQLSIETNNRIANNIGFIKNAIERDAVGKKRKSARC